MPTSAGTDPSDVKGVIDTDLSDSDINSKLDDAEFDTEQANDTSAMSTMEIQQLEKYLAALKIVESKDPRARQESVGDWSATYDGSTVVWLKREVDRRDPSGTLAHQRDTDRHVTSTGGG